MYLLGAAAVHDDVAGIAKCRGRTVGSVAHGLGLDVHASIGIDFVAARCSHVDPLFVLAHGHRRTKAGIGPILVQGDQYLPLFEYVAVGRVVDHGRVALAIVAEIGTDHCPALISKIDAAPEPGHICCIQLDVSSKHVLIEIVLDECLHCTRTGAVGAEILSESRSSDQGR